MITSNITMRTFHIATTEDAGSAFSIEYEGFQFLITAKHVIESIDFQNGDEIEILIFHDGEWKSMKCTVYVHENPDIDIVVLQARHVEFTILPIQIGLENLYIARDIYFLGFPYGMFSPDKGNVNHKFPFPFAKKGILSSIIREDDITSIYIDAHNNSGFSGGPVFITESNNIQIIGVNVSYLKHENTIIYDEVDDDGEIHQEQFEYYENSGIMKSQSIDHAIEIIKQNKISLR